MAFQSKPESSEDESDGSPQHNGSQHNGYAAQNGYEAQNGSASSQNGSTGSHNGSTDSHNGSAGSHNDSVDVDSQNGSPAEVHPESPSGSETDDITDLPSGSTNYFSISDTDGLKQWREPPTPEQEPLFKECRDKIRERLIVSDQWDKLKALMERKLCARGWEVDMVDLIRDEMRMKGVSVLSFDELALKLRNSYKDKFKMPDKFCQDLQIEMLNRMKHCYDSYVPSEDASDSGSTDEEVKIEN